jgi:hypothetical protein
VECPIEPAEPDVAIGCVERLKKMGYGDEQEKEAQSKAKGGKKPEAK